MSLLGDTTTSATQVAGSLARDDLGDVEVVNGEVKSKGNFTQLLYDLTNTTGYMLPTALVSIAVNAVASPFAGAAIATSLGSAAGSVVLGASTGGNGYSQMINLGYDKGQAMLYGSLVGVAAAGLNYFLGGIKNVGGSFTEKALAKVIAGTDNAIAKTAIAYGGRMLFEGAQQSFSEMLDPVFKNIATGTDYNKVDVGQSLYSGVMAAVTAGILNIPSQIGEYKGWAKESTNARNNYITSDISKTLSDKLGTDTGAYSTAKILYDSGLNLSKKNKADFESGLVESGVDKGSAKVISKTLEKVTNGEELSKQQQYVLDNNPFVSEEFRKAVTGEKADVGGASLASGTDILGKNGADVNTSKPRSLLSDQDESALKITDDQIQSERANGETTYAKYLEGLRDNARVEDGKRIERDAILKQYPPERLQELAKNGDYDTISFVNAKLKALDKRTDFEADNSFYRNLSIENSQRNSALENGNNVKVAMPEYAMARAGGNGIEGEFGEGNAPGSYGFDNVTDSAGEGNRAGFSGSGNENESLGVNGGNGSIGSGGGLHNNLNDPTTGTPTTTTANSTENQVGAESQGITPDSTISENTVDGKIRGEYNENTGKNHLYRGDDILFEEKRPNGISKSHLNTDGDLVPANVDGLYKDRQVTVTEHILGGYRKGAKGNSPYTSFTNDKGIVANYGNSTIKVDLDELTRDINAGKVQGVEILTPKQVQALIKSDVQESEYWKDLALRWAQRDNEHLIKGTIPKKYIKIITDGGE